MANVPSVTLSSCGDDILTMPIIGMGTSSYPRADPETDKAAILEAIRAGYRHFDTAAAYGSEKDLGDAISEALRLQLIKSRDELFITTKLWASFAEKDLVLPSIKSSLRNLQVEYIDMYIIHWPFKLAKDVRSMPVERDLVQPLDIKSVWEAMEECKKLGLARGIGVSNFTSTMLEELLSFAEIPPAVNQLEMNPAWQLKKLRDFCKAKGIHVTAYSPLGAARTKWGDDRVLGSDIIEEIAEAKGKSTAQISLRWAYEQGVSIVTKSYNKGRMRQNLDIFDFCLTEEELEKMSHLPQRKGVTFASLIEEIAEAKGKSTEAVLHNLSNKTHHQLHENHVTEECQLPLIDLDGLNSLDMIHRQECARAICSASSEWGFFQVVNHGISLELIEKMRREQVKLFSAPFDKKQNSGLLNNSYRFGTTTATHPSQFSWSEAFHIPVSKISDQACYGDDFTSLREVMEEYSAAMSNLSKVLAEVLINDLGNSDEAVGDICESSSCFLRLNRYPACPYSPEMFGQVPHTDSGFLTILCQDQVGGLQLMQDSKWVAVKPNPDALIVNIGDLFQAWSNGVYKSVEHKVMANEKTDRYSIAYFLCPLPGYSTYAGRGQVLDTINEIQERHCGVKAMERKLNELHQVFLDMAVLVLAQGEQIDAIESHVDRASLFVQHGNQQLQKARFFQKHTRKWTCYGILILLIIIGIILASTLTNYGVTYLMD